MDIDTENRAIDTSNVTAGLSKAIVNEVIAKQICLRMYCNGIEFRQIERCTGIEHNSVINWVKERANRLL